MNKLILYVVRDTLACDSSLILTAKNDEILKRNVKGVLLSQQQNFINTDTKDKFIYVVGELDTDTGIVKGLDNPVPVVCIEELRLELVQEMKRLKAQQELEKTIECEVVEDGGKS